MAVGNTSRVQIIPLITSKSIEIIVRKALIFFFYLVQIQTVLGTCHWEIIGTISVEVEQKLLLSPQYFIPNTLLLSSPNSDCTWYISLGNYWHNSVEVEIIEWDIEPGCWDALHVDGTFSIIKMS